MKSNSILMLLDGFYPTDLRLEKEISALIEAGFQVTLLCYRRKNEPETEEIESLKVIRSKNAIGHFKKGWIDLWNATVFENLIISRSLKKLKDKYDFLHVHDLPIAKTGLEFAEKIGATAILDLHENYPEALKIWFTWRKSALIRLKNRLFFSYTKWFSRERRMVREYDHIIAVVDEMKERLVKLHEIRESKITVVSNTEPKERFDRIEKLSNSDYKNIVYVGGIGPHRGLDTAIVAMPELIAHDDSFRLQIVGSGNKDTIEFLKLLSCEKNVEKYVEFVGQVPLEKALGFMRGAYMNIIPHHANDHTNNTIPHKLFQIMNSGYPLMVSSCTPLKRIVENTQSGLVFEAGDSKSFAEQLIWSTRHQDTIAQYSANGRDAVQNRGLNWESDGERLVNLYRELLSN